MMGQPQTEPRLSPGEVIVPTRSTSSGSDSIETKISCRYRKGELGGRCRVSILVSLSFFHWLVEMGDRAHPVGAAGTRAFALKFLVTSSRRERPSDQTLQGPMGGNGVLIKGTSPV